MFRVLVMLRRLWKLGVIWPVLLTVTIAMVSGTSELAVPDVPLITWDKLAHFLVFGLVATSILRTLPRDRYPLGTLLLAVVLTSLWGAADELRQSMTPGRYLEFADWIADTTGALVAAAVYQYWGAYRRLLEMRVLGKPRQLNVG